MKRLVPYLIGAAATAAVFGVAALAIVEFGLFEVQASVPHSPLVAWATHTTMIHAVDRDAAAIPRLRPFTVAETEAGFRLYDRDCVACHGAPGVPREPWAAGMTPSPPYLIDAPRHWTSRQLNFIVSNGVKMTGMPAWSTVHSPAELRAIVAFLEAQPYLTARDYLRFRQATTGGRLPVRSRGVAQTTPSPPVTP
ncbi:MAG TPA: cytochrome c [Caulobacteraceae bacterium]|jgi:mono/diheme cytochrome c family protein|nr:cytochrome c [Caulobacteraceae bacterium]